MDNTTIVAIQKAQELLKAGNKQEAQAILIPVVRANQDIAEAWYLLGFAVTDPEKRMVAFQQVLRIDPSNQPAQKQIAKLLAARAAAPAAEMPVAPRKKAQKKQVGSKLVWGLAGAVTLLLCFIIAGGWWISRNGLPVFEAPSPTTFSRHPTPRPTVTLYPSSTHTPTSIPSLTPTPSLTVTQLIRSNATSNATPNLAAFAIVLSPVPNVTLDFSSLTLEEMQKIAGWARSGQMANADLTSDITLNVGSDKYSYTAGDIATFAAQLKDKGVGLAGVTMSVVFTLPDQTTETISLKDYGDGVYAATYTIPDAPGFAFAQITVKGNSNGTNFVQRAASKFTIFPGDIVLTGEYSDKLVEKDGYKTLDIQVGINAGHAGDFTLSGALEDTEHKIKIQSNTVVSVLPGHNVVTISFRGEDFQFKRVDGPYWVSLRFADHKTGVYSGEVDNVWQTAAYPWRDFGDELCYSLTTNVKPDPSMASITVSTKPNCPNGKYLSGTQVTLIATAKPGFQFTGWGGDVGTAASFLPTTTIMIGRDMVANAFFEKKP
jgi:hypothetical protein